LRSQRGTAFRQALEEEFEDGSRAQGVGIIGIFIARGNVPYTLLAQVVERKVHPPGIAGVSEHGGQLVREAELGIGVVEQDQPGIRRQAAAIEIESDGFGPDRGQRQRDQWKWGGPLGWHRINLWDRVCCGAINVHVDSLL
jgi:hypothetical protein